MTFLVRVNKKNTLNGVGNRPLDLHRQRGGKGRAIAAALARAGRE